LRGVKVGEGRARGVWGEWMAEATG